MLTYFRRSLLPVSLGAELSARWARARYERHEAGLKLFRARQYEETARELESITTRELWNEWAVVEPSYARIATR